MSSFDAEVSGHTLLERAGIPAFWAMIGLNDYSKLSTSMH